MNRFKHVILKTLAGLSLVLPLAHAHAKAFEIDFTSQNYNWLDEIVLGGQWGSHSVSLNFPFNA